MISSPLGAFWAGMFCVEVICVAASCAGIFCVDGICVRVFCVVCLCLGSSWIASDGMAVKGYDLCDGFRA